MNAKSKMLCAAIAIAATAQFSAYSSVGQPVKKTQISTSKSDVVSAYEEKATSIPRPVVVASTAGCQNQITACAAVERGNVLSCMADFKTGLNAPGWCFAEASDSLYSECRAMDTTRYCATSNSYSLITMYKPETGVVGTKTSNSRTVRINCSTDLGRVEAVTITWGKGSTSANKPARVLSVGIYCSDGTNLVTSKERGGGVTALNGDNSDVTYSRTQTMTCPTGYLLGRVPTTSYDVGGYGLKSIGMECRQINGSSINATPPPYSAKVEYGIDTNGSTSAGLGGTGSLQTCEFNYLVKGFELYDEVVEFDDYTSTTHRAITGMRVNCAVIKHNS